MNWKDAYKEVIPLHYLREHAHKSNRELASSLSELTGERITKNAVKNARRRYQVQTTVPTTTSSNYEEICLESTAPITLQDLIDTFGINTQEYELIQDTPGSWQAQASNETKRIIYEEGRIQEGEIHKTGNSIVTLYKRNAIFRKRKLDPVELSIQPVVCNVNYFAPATQSAPANSAHLVFSDPHFGYTIDYRTGKLTPLHNRAVLNLILQIAAETQPNSIHILGDIFDFAEQSDKFLSSPDFHNTVQPAIEEVHLYLRWLRESCPNSTICIHQGNHDNRPERALLKHVNWAYGLKAADEIELPPQLSVPRLLALHKLHIQYITDYPNDFEIIGNVELDHGYLARAASGASVTASIKESGISKIFGHIHRVELASKTIWEGPRSKQIQHASCGCCCHTDGRVPGVKARQNWQNGFAFIHSAASHSFITPYAVSANQTHFQSALRTGTDYTPALCKANRRWNW